VRRRRLDLKLHLTDWLDQALAGSDVTCAPIGRRVAVRAVDLPEHPPRFRRPPLSHQSSVTTGCNQSRRSLRPNPIPLPAERRDGTERTHQTARPSIIHLPVVPRKRRLAADLTTTDPSPTMLRGRFQSIIDALMPASLAVHGDRLLSAAVFGAVAWDTKRPDSDIDLLLEVDDLPHGHVLRGTRSRPWDDGSSHCSQKPRRTESRQPSRGFKTRGSSAAAASSSST